MREILEITKLDNKVAALLDQQIWPKHLGASEYFNQTSQGNRFDDELYSRVSNYLLPEIKSILDIGAGEGKLAEQLMSENYEVTCLEPSQKRYNILKSKKISSIHCSFQQLNSIKIYDCSILLRSIGIASKIGDRFSLYDTLKKIISLSKSQVLVISKAIEEKSFVPLEFQNFDIYNKKPWTYHYDMLKLMKYSPLLSYISLELDKPYKSIEECIQKDFSKDNLKQVKEYLAKFSYYKEKVFYRRVKLMFPVVNLTI